MKIELKDFLGVVKKMVKGGLIYIFTGSILTTLVGMLSSVVVARIVDTNAYAHLTYADNLYTYVGLISGMGLSNALLRHLSTIQDKNTKHVLFVYALIVGVLFNVFIVGCLLVYVKCTDIPFVETIRYVYFLAFYPIVTYIFNLLLTYFRSLLKNRVYAGMGLLQSVIVCVCSVGFVMKLEAFGVVVARYIGAIIVIFVAILYLKKNERITVRKQYFDKKLAKSMLIMGISLAIANLCSGMMAANESLLIGNIIRDEQVVANYKVASLIPTQLTLIPGAFATYLFPIVGMTQDVKTTKQIVFQTVGLNAFLVIICVIIGVAISPQLLAILYNHKYDGAVEMMRLLWIIRGVNAIFRIIPMNMIPAMGKVKFNVIISAVSGGIHFVLNDFLLRHLGISGILLGTTSIYLVTAVFYWVYFIHICKEKKDGRCFAG